MGDPRKERRDYKKPKRPLDKVRIDRDAAIINRYGLRNRREVWKAESMLKRYRRKARAFLASEGGEDFISSLRRKGIISDKDDVLDLKLEDILDRRLQSMVYNKNLANSMRHARQLIVHGHVSVNGRKVTIPGYMVDIEEEDLISL